MILISFWDALLVFPYLHLWPENARFCLWKFNHVAAALNRKCHSFHHVLNISSWVHKLRRIYSKLLYMAPQKNFIKWKWKSPHTTLKKVSVETPQKKFRKWKWKFLHKRRVGATRGQTNGTSWMQEFIILEANRASLEDSALHSVYSAQCKHSKNYAIVVRRDQRSEQNASTHKKCHHCS